MTFEEKGNMDGKTLMLLPGTCCDWQTNFGSVIDRLSEKYHLICVNYDGFDGGSDIFPDMITITEKIEKYMKLILMLLMRLSRKLELSGFPPIASLLQYLALQLVGVQLIRYRQLQTSTV